MAEKAMRVEGFEGVDKLFRQLGNTQAFCEEAVAEAAPTLVKSAKASVHDAIYSPPVQRKTAREEGQPTGSLERSFVATKATTNRYGSYCTVGPVGYREGKTTKGAKLHHAAQAAFLEWGTSQGQEPSPWRAKAVKNAENDCQRIMEETVKKEVNKFWPVEGS